MSRFLFLSKGLFRIVPLTLFELIRCKRMREEFTAALTLYGEEPKQARELAGAVSLCFFSLKPVLARRFSSPEQVYRTLTLTQLQKIAARYPDTCPEESVTETGFNQSFAKEEHTSGHA